LAATDLAAVRAAEFGRLGSTIYLNAAAYGPMPDRSVRAARDIDERRAAVGLRFEEFDAGLGRARRACAALIGAEEAEIGLTPNTSVGLNLAADIVRQHAQDGRRVVVLPDREFPANVYGWLSLEADGFTVERIATDACGLPREDALLERLRQGDVAALAISAVQFASGYRADLERLGAACAAEGALFVVDAIQALGSVQIDVRVACIDVLACGGQKWLCGPFGTGFVFVRSGLVTTSEPHRPGWLSFESTSDFGRLLDYRRDFWHDARRFEVGSLGLQNFLALAYSIELILEIGVDTIHAHNRRLQEPLLEWARSTDGVEPLIAGGMHGSGILSLRARAADALHTALARAGAICVTREGAVRFAPHFYNTMEEMERVLESLRSARL
jgi:cysteine desulfurase / selenocysteine lyase